MAESQVSDGSAIAGRGSTPDCRPAAGAGRFSSPSGPELEVIIPALNEERRIGPTLARICAFLAQLPFPCAVTVVDNGSADGTPDVVKGWQDSVVPVRLLGCRRPGKGAAVKVGMMAATGRWVGFCDADLATPITTLDSVLTLLQAGSPVVIGSRRCGGASYERAQPLVRRTGGWAFRRLTRSLCGGVTDTQCGFKFFERETARRLFERLHSAGFAFDLELLAIARRHQVPVAEVPVRWTDQTGSSLRPLEDAVQILREIRTLRRLADAPRWDDPNVLAAA